MGVRAGAELECVRVTVGAFAEAAGCVAGWRGPLAAATSGEDAAGDGVSGLDVMVALDEPPPRSREECEHEQHEQDETAATTPWRRRGGRVHGRGLCHRRCAREAQLGTGQRMGREPGSGGGDERRLHLAQRHLERIDVLAEGPLQQRRRKAQDDLVHLEVVVPNGHPDRHVQRHRWQRQVELTELVPQHQLGAAAAHGFVPHRVGLRSDLFLSRSGSLVHLGGEHRLGLTGDVAHARLLDDEAEPHMTGARLVGQPREAFARLAEHRLHLVRSATAPRHVLCRDRRRLPDLRRQGLVVAGAQSGQQPGGRVVVMYVVETGRLSGPLPRYERAFSHALRTPLRRGLLRTPRAKGPAARVTWGLAEHNGRPTVL